MEEGGEMRDSHEANRREEDGESIDEEVLLCQLLGLCLCPCLCVCVCACLCICVLHLPAAHARTHIATERIH